MVESGLKKYFACRLIAMIQGSTRCSKIFSCFIFAPFCCPGQKKLPFPGAVFNLDNSVMDAITSINMRVKTYVIFKAAGSSMALTVAKIGQRGASFADFKKDIANKDDCAYGMFDGGRTTLMIMWIPDSAPVKTKMLYSSGFDDVRRISGSARTLKAFTANDLDAAQKLL